jgi:hypothetical protein
MKNSKDRCSILTEIRQHSKEMEGEPLEELWNLILFVGALLGLALLVTIGMMITK